MKVAIVSESPADEAALLLFVRAILGTAVEFEPVTIRHTGWTHLVQVLPKIITAVHYNTSADALVVVLDADDSLVHESQHDPTDAANATCRICRIIEAIDRAKCLLRKRPSGRELLFAFGLAVPAMEAWLLCGIDHAVSEASWRNGRRQGIYPYTTLDLKQRLYGSRQPSLDHEMEVMVGAAERIVTESRLQLLEGLFPAGFGLFASQLRDWLTPPTA